MAITILVKNPNAAHDGCRIHYRDIGDYLSREKKLEALHKAGSISSLTDWQVIDPDRHNDWTGLRSDVFAQFYAMGSKNVKAKLADTAIFGLYSLGLLTTRDAYIYNFSQYACNKNAQRMTENYRAAISEIEANPGLSVEAAAHRHSSNLKWAGNLKDNLKQRKTTEFEQGYIRKVAYRPFVAMNCYCDYIFIHRKHQMHKIFPESSSENRVIGVPGIGSKNQFSVLITDKMTDINLNESSAQCFPRYYYLKPEGALGTTNTLKGISEASERIDNISDTALGVFRERYRDETITKDTLFDYVYGVLHAPRYQEEFANDLSKQLPRIPFAPDFYAFAEAGEALGELHLGYERCERYPLEVVFAHGGEPQARHFRLTEKAMRFVDDDKTTLRINDHVSLSGIPVGASVRGQREDAARVVY